MYLNFIVVIYYTDKFFLLVYAACTISFFGNINPNVNPFSDQILSKILSFGLKCL